MALKTMRDEHGEALKQTHEEQAAAVERQAQTSAELEQAQRELQELQVLVAVGTQHLCAQSIAAIHLHLLHLRRH
eukprot:COSAG02_NODE_24304_length_692_cov_1.204047_2_plen_75_part_00